MLKPSRKSVRKILQGPVVLSILSWLAIRYLKLVCSTNRIQYDPPEMLEQAKSLQPFIVGVWHGQHILLPALPFGFKACAMISRNFDGEITARIVEYFGSRTIRASGGRDPKNTLKKGGISGFLDMMNALENGDNVIQTADIPRGAARKAGMGIINLAHRSGSPIVILAVASSRRKVFERSWDRTTFNLPFGRIAVCGSDPIHVPHNADDKELERCRVLLENELTRITVRAYDLVGNPE